LPLAKLSYYAWSYINKLISDYPPYVYFLLHTNQDTILLCRSTDNGASWQAAVPVVVGSSPQNVKLAADGSNRLYLTWGDNGTGAYEVYYRRSTDNGTSWSQVTRLTTSTGTQPDWLQTIDDIVYLRYGVTCKRSFDGGASWESEQWPYQCCGLNAVSEGGRIHALWSGTYRIVYLRSRDAGTSWTDTTVVSDSDALNRYPHAMTVAGGNVHVLWQDYESGNYEVLYRRGAGLADIVEQNPYSVPPVVRGPTVLSSETAVRLARSGSIFDVMGRRNFAPEPGVYFMRETQTQAPVVRKVVVAR